VPVITKLSRSVRLAILTEVLIFTEPTMHGTCWVLHISAPTMEITMVRTMRISMILIIRITTILFYIGLTAAWAGFGSVLV